MAPKKKFPVDQQAFIELWMPEYLLKRAGGKSDEFWIKMKKAFFSEWPEEACLGLPVQQIDPDENAEPPRRLTEGEKERLDDAIETRVGQLKNSFRNAYAKIRGQKGGVGKSALSLAALLFKARPKMRRRHQVLELYHKLFKAKVQAALKKTEYDQLNEAAECRDNDGVWVDDEDDELKMKRVTNARSQRMKIVRRVVRELWEEESEVLKQEIRESVKKEVVVPEKVEAAEGEEAVERTPEEYQMSIDESLQVAEMFLGEFQKMTGWMGALVYGGPVPKNKGAVGVKCVPFGTTPEGLSFDRWHPNWKKKITDPLVRFLQQAIPRDVRLRRAIFTGDEDSDDDNEEVQRRAVPAPVEDREAPTPTTKAKKKTTKDPDTTPSKPPRRPQKKKKKVAREGPTSADVVAQEPQPEFMLEQPAFDGGQLEVQDFTQGEPVLEGAQLGAQEDFTSPGHASQEDTGRWMGMGESFVFPPAEQMVQTRGTSNELDFSFPTEEELVQMRLRQPTANVPILTPGPDDGLGVAVGIRGAWQRIGGFWLWIRVWVVLDGPPFVSASIAAAFACVFNSAPFAPAARCSQGPRHCRLTQLRAARDISSWSRGIPVVHSYTKDNKLSIYTDDTSAGGPQYSGDTWFASDIGVGGDSDGEDPSADNNTCADFPSHPVIKHPAALVVRPCSIVAPHASPSPSELPAAGSDAAFHRVAAPPYAAVARAEHLVWGASGWATESPVTAAERATKLAAARVAKAKPGKAKAKAKAKGKAKSIEEGHALGTEEGRALVTEELRVAGENQTPVLTYSSTNNNRSRLKAMKLAEALEEREAKARKAAVLNPDGPSDLFITSGRPRRTIYEPVNRGAVLSLKERSDALDAKAKAADDALLKALTTGKKRVAETQENRVPTKRARKG
ncbi:hypothetical protein C8R44DRAFT_880775 [Mycena epipterygia]|nr:hypothetical protein C8R44DRAFT_880775 [Mycena epipterygia]